MATRLISEGVKLSWGVAALALATTGCSLGMHTAPSDPSERTHEAARECTSSYLHPIGDVAGAAVGAINIGIAASADDGVSIYGTEASRKVGIGLGITQLALFGAAATYGFIQAGRCNALRHEQHVLTDGEVAALPPPPPPPPADPPPDTPAGAADASGASTTAALPEWSAFRRVPLGPLPETPGKALPQRFAPP